MTNFWENNFLFSQITSQAQANTLLDLLPTRGAKAFKLFVDALREDYEWLVDEIESAVNNPEPIDAIDSSKIENVRKTSL